VFLNCHRWSLRNTRKRDKTPKNAEGKLTSKFLSVFMGKVFDMDEGFWIFEKIFIGAATNEERLKTH
jgi:hypothetical protein